MLTKRETALIKKSWTSVKKIDPLVLGDIFYSKLFFDNPELRKMFPQNMEEQYQKLLDMLNTIVERLEKLDELKGDIVAMAKRHKDYGVKPQQYSMVGIALIWTLQKTLGQEWNEDIRSAWVNCYAILSGTMITVADK
ncbi:MAG TPA: globin domain-containing protein [Chitinophagaceae bacterium]|nr:globin domain-containing protein [Chitinophagaceae bacterium]